MFQSLRQPSVLMVTLAAAGILMVTMGIRQSLGLFITPISASEGLSITTISFAFALGQLVWGLVQPFAGVLSDLFGPRKVLNTGLLIMALGAALIPIMPSGFGLTITIGVLSAVGSGIGSFSVLMGAAAQQLPPEARAEASGVINAGSSFGQFIFAPIAQTLMQLWGWMGALWALAGLTLTALPLVNKVAKPSLVLNATTTTSSNDAWLTVRHAMKVPSYLLLHAGFFTCGFHIAFLVTHLPGEVNLCGLPPTVASWSLALIGLSNIFGSLVAGWCVARYRSKYILAIMYGSRALLILWYLAMPRTEWVYYTFAIGLGFTWLATVPPTAALVGKLFGVRYLATLFGLTVLSHQIGGFLGAYLGGITLTRFGDFTWMWYADMVLAAIAALVNLPIKEAAIPKNIAAA